MPGIPVAGCPRVEQPSGLYFDRHPACDLDTLIAQYPSGEFESPYRSTVPLLSMIRDGQTGLREILASCGFQTAVQLHFEFTVSPPIGQGKASHTDLMVCTNDSCIAVEAKWTEPPYETVSDWLGLKPTANRLNVIAGWLSLIQRFTTKRLCPEDVASVTYQMIHRAASACATAVRPQLSYLQFVSGDYGGAPIREKRTADLDRLRVALGRPDGFPFFLIEMEIEPTSAFNQLAMLPKSNPQTSVAVRRALSSSALFAFPQVRLHRLL